MDGNSPDPLYNALCELCNLFESASRIECQTAIAAAHTQVGPEASDTIYRAVRELLINVRLHASATRVEVTSGASRDGWLRFSVADNGVGFATPWRRPGTLGANGGLGLWSIERRLRHLEGYLDIDSRGKGTRATVVLPARHLTKA